MNHGKGLLLSCYILLVGLLVGLIGAPPVAWAAYNNWEIVSSPNCSDENELFSVAAAASDAVVAVGRCYSSGHYSPMIQRWGGTSWSIVTGPILTTSENALHGVTYISPSYSNATAFWAVGQGGGSTLTVRSTDLGQTWAAVSSANPSSYTSAFLESVSGVDLDDVWAVGYYLPSTSGALKQTLIEHWNGSSWSVVSSPNVSNKDNHLYSVSANASDDIWAVGALRDPSTGAYSTLTEHWNGTSWSIVSSPNPGTQNNSFYGVTTLSNGDAWAVGTEDDGSSPSHSLLAFWNSSSQSWSALSNPPSPGSEQNVLWGIAPVTSTYLWAVGRKQNTSSPNNTFTARYRASTWSGTSSPNQGSTDNELRGVAAVPGTATCDRDIWAVGSYIVNGHPQTLIERYINCDD